MRVFNGSAVPLLQGFRLGAIAGGADIRCADIVSAVLAAIDVLSDIEPAVAASFSQACRLSG